MKPASVLPGSFARQSRLRPVREVSSTVRAQARTFLWLSAVSAAGLAIAEAARTTAGFTFGLGLMTPGAGFAAPMLAAGEFQPVAVVLVLASMLSFGGALLLWFGTGNVLAPLLTWLAAAIVAASTSNADPVATSADAGAILLGVAAIMPGAMIAGAAVARGRARAAPPASPAVTPPAIAAPISDELDVPTLQLMRMLLDRALQPVKTFDGFEWRDQFQTAAVRYQLNFVSYALAVAQAHQLPAFSGYMVEAQRRLLAKQSDPRIWRYWALESGWGHLRPAANPVPRDNIMYSGFVAAQVALAEAACARSIATGGHHLRLEAPNGRLFLYDRDALIEVLAGQYRCAPWGLLACEPHWIYPLCNLITASALRATDARAWDEVAGTFRGGLLREFTTRGGDLVPFRSSLTGLAPPGAGGIVMQAFPCLFLNAVFPDLAREHWERVRARLATRAWGRAFWPIDVGNYGFSRASSLAASAAAAVEMGDGENAAAMLAMLDRECPAIVRDGVRHRPRASLWSHALELFARCNHQNGLADLVAGTARGDGPHLASARYPDVLVARAVARGARLELVLHPGRAGGDLPIALGGLLPGRHYRIEGGRGGFVRADDRGTAELAVTLRGRTALSIFPVI